MKKPVLLALALLACAPSFAQEFFGITASDAQAMIAQVQADQKLQQLKALGYAPSRLPSVEKALGLTKTLDSRQDCILDAVAAHLGVREFPYGTDFPSVLFASDVDGARYQAAVKAQYPASNPTAVVATIYLPAYNVIYLADSARAYADGATMDAALAAQYARFVDARRGVSDPAHVDSDAASVQSWYRARYPAGRTSCASN